MIADDGIVACIAPQRNMLVSAQRRAARARCQAPPGVGAAIDRMTDGEGAINELNNCHALDRARSRGKAKPQIQPLLAATAINLKRLAGRRPAAAHSADGDTETIAGCLGGAGDAHHHAIRAHTPIITACLSWLRRLDQADSLTGS